MRIKKIGMENIHNDKMVEIIIKNVLLINNYQYFSKENGHKMDLSFNIIGKKIFELLYGNLLISQRTHSTN